MINFGVTGVRTRPLLANAIALIAFSTLVLSLNRGALFYGLDGNYMKILIQNQFQWMPFGMNLGANPLQGNWNSFIGYNMNLIPAFSIQAHFLNGQVDPVLTYTVFALELAFATYLVGNLLSLHKFERIAAAWLLPLLTLPFIWGPSLIFPLYVLIPQGVDLVLGQAVLMWALVRSDDRALRNVTSGLIIILVVGWLVVANPLTVMIIVPTVAAAYLTIIVSSKTRRVLLWRLILVALLALVMIAGGFVHFLIGQTFYSVPAFFSNELWVDKPDLTGASIVFQWRDYSSFGLVLVFLSVVGATLTAVRQTGLPRNLAIAHLVLTAMYVGGGYLLVRYVPGWRGPAMLYFEISIYAFYCLFAVHAVMLTAPRLVHVANKLLSAYGPRALVLSSDKTFLAVAIFGLVLIAGLAAKGRPSAQYLPISETTFVKFLRAEIGLQPPSLFRGRVATFAGGDPATPIGWIDQYQRDNKALASAGNESRTIGFWTFGIPTLIEYNHYITPPDYLLLSRTLARPIDPQLRNIMALTVPNAPILQALGVRFVISDRSLGDEFQLREVMKSATDPELRLYELPKPNLGNYSPTRTVLAKDASDALAILKNGFDFQNLAVVTEPLTEALVPASSVRLRFETGAFNLHAESQGRSLLVLPVEFSRCLTVSSALSSNGDVRIFRTNLVQVGVLFSTSLDVKVTFESGPFAHATCRVKDIEDMRALDLPAAAKRFPLNLAGG